MTRRWGPIPVPAGFGSHFGACPGSGPGTCSAADQGGEDIEESKEGYAGFACLRWVDLQFEEIEAGEALDRGATGDGVVTGTLTWRHSARALRDIERHGNGRAVELV